MATPERGLRSGRGLLLCAAVALGLACPAAAETMFIGDFEALGDEWTQLLDKGITVEGRVGIFAGTQLRFAGSEMRVQVPVGTKRSSQTDRYRVSGLLKSERGRPLLDAFSVRPLSRTELWVADLQAAIDTDDPAAWFAAAAEIRKRGQYYADADLLARATELDSRGFRLVAAAAGHDAAALRAAVEQGAARDIPEQTLAPVRHRAAIADWDAVEPRAASLATADREALLRRIRDDLPRASRPLASVDNDLAANYRLSPERTYAEQVDRRGDLERLFFIDVVESLAKARLAPDGRNADTIADDLARLLPDRPETVAAYRRRGGDAMLDAIGTMSEDEAIALADRLARSRGPERREATIRQWLSSRRRSAELDGADAVATLAEDTARLTQDRDATAELMMLANRLDPRLKPPRDWLRANGYEQVGSRWRRQAFLEEDAVDPADEVGQPITVGLTSAQARQRAGTLPDRTVRLVSAGRVLEYWTYNDLDLVLTIERIAGRGRVISVQPRTTGRDR